PFATTKDTIEFVQHSERIAASGFSVEDLNYLLRHDFPANSPIAINDATIAAVLGSIREELRKVVTENSVASDDPDDDLTNRKIAIVIQRLGEYLNFPSSSARELLTNWVNSTADPTKKAIDLFVATEFAESNPDDEVSRVEFPNQFNMFVRLYKIAALNHDFRLTAQQLQWLFDFGPSNGWLDLNKLPFVAPAAAAPPLYPSWARIADLFQLSAALPLAESVLTDVFTSAKNGTTITTLLGKISQGLSWKLENLTALN